jgi:FtsP/CotA-like multicopper oxidase with cupredoxin domain
VQQVIRRGGLALALIAALGACDGSVSKKKSDAPTGVPNTKRYPPTGVTKKFTLTISEFDWEVAPNAIYQAIGYNKQLPGPVLEVNAGDKVELTLINETDAPHSAHTHVVEFDDESDGSGGHEGDAGHDDNNHGVAPAHGRVTVTWNAVYAGTFPYHDHAHADHAEGAVDGITAGLVGALVVNAPDQPKPDKSHVVVLMDMDLTRYKTLPGTYDDAGVLTDGEYKGGHGYMHVINGRAYEEWIPKFTGRVGERIRWGVVTVGREFHTFHVHGHRWIGADGVLTDNIALGPGMYSTLEWIEDNPGTWLVHCHVPDHMEGGMVAQYVVEGGSSDGTHTH